MLRSSRTGPTKIGSLSRASAVIVGALVALFGVIAGPLLGFFATSASAATPSGYTALTLIPSTSSRRHSGQRAGELDRCPPGRRARGCRRSGVGRDGKQPNFSGLPHGIPRRWNRTDNQRQVHDRRDGRQPGGHAFAASSGPVYAHAQATAVDVDVEGYYRTHSG